MDQFSRLKKLINDSEWQKIKDLHVLIVGIGGVGGYTVEALTRMGVGYLTIVDSDVVDITNLNRQIISLHSNLNDDKVLVAKKRCLDINPNIQVKAIKQFVDEKNAPQKCIANLGDLIYTRTGQVGYIFNNRHGVVHNNCFTIEPTVQDVTKDYIYWFLKQNTYPLFVPPPTRFLLHFILSHSASAAFRYTFSPLNS